MPFDLDLANRIRAIVAEEPGISEQRMFGGLAFLVGGHMAVAASGQGGVLVRVDPGETAALLAEPGGGADGDGRTCDGWMAAGERRERLDRRGAERLGGAGRHVRAVVAPEVAGYPDIRHLQLLCPADLDRSRRLMARILTRQRVRVHSPRSREALREELDRDRRRQHAGRLLLDEAGRRYGEAAG